MHILVWAAVPLAFLHSSIAGLNFENELGKLAILGFGSLYLLAFVQLFFKKWQHFVIVLVSWILGMTLLAVLYPTTLEEFNQDVMSSSKAESNEKTSSSSTSSLSSKFESSISSSSLITSSAASIISSASSSAQSFVKTVSNSELSANNSSSNCWISFGKKVYNVTDYLNQHPGGRRELLRVCGKEIDNLSGSHPGGSFNSSEIQGILSQFFVGNLV